MNHLKLSHVTQIFFSSVPEIRDRRFNPLYGTAIESTSRNYFDDDPDLIWTQDVVTTYDHTCDRQNAKRFLIEVEVMATYLLIHVHHVVLIHFC